MRIESLLGSTLGSSNGTFVIAEWKDVGSDAEPPMMIAPFHLHRNEDEAWYCLEGEIAVQCGDEVHRIGPGGAVLVPKGEPHSFWFPKPGPVRYLIVMGPKTAALVDALHDGTSRSFDEVRSLFEDYDSQIL